MLIPVAYSPVTLAQRDQPLKVGLLSDFSGELLLYGLELDYGFTLGMEYVTGGSWQIAGQPVEIIARDYAGDGARAVALAHELIEEEAVQVLVGAPSSGVTRDLVALAAQHNVILMAGPAADPRITGEWFEPTTFRVCHNAIHDTSALAAWAVENIGPRFVQLAPDHPYGYGWAESFEIGFAAQGATMAAGPIFVPITTADFSPYLQQALAAGADGVIVTWAGPGMIPLFQQAARLELNTSADQPAVLTLFGSNDTVRAFGDSSQIGVIGLVNYHYSLPQNAINDWLVKRHLAEYGDFPDQFTECGFASALALAEALKLTGGNAQPEALIPALEGLTFEGPRGIYTIRTEDHQAIMPATIARLISVDDPDQRLYEQVAEIPVDAVVLPCTAPRSRRSDAVTCSGK